MAAQPFWYENIQADYVQVGTKTVEAIYRGSTLLWGVEPIVLGGQADIAADTFAQAELTFSFDVSLVAIGTVESNTTAGGTINYGWSISPTGRAEISAAIAINGEKTHDFLKNIETSRPDSIAALIEAAGWIYVSVAPVVGLSASAVIEGDTQASGEIGYWVTDFSCDGTAQIDADLLTDGDLHLSYGYNGVYYGARQIEEMYTGPVQIEWVFLGTRLVYGPWLASAIATELAEVITTESDVRLIA